MQPDFACELKERLPDEISLPYFPGLEAAWMLRARMAGRTRISELRKGPLAPLLNQPCIRKVIALCGDGWLDPADLAPLADPLLAFGAEAGVQNAVSDAAAEVFLDADIRWFTISFDLWGSDNPYGESDSHRLWQYFQTSRRGLNLVVKVNFPEAHQVAFDAVAGMRRRKSIENYSHPVNKIGPITMAWARIDLEPDSGEMLIEELQTDWLRGLKWFRLPNPSVKGRRYKRWLKKHGLVKYSYADRLELFEFYRDWVDETYRRCWAQATLFAALSVAVSKLGVKQIWIHQPESGERLKFVDIGTAPVSIYRDVPRHFGFSATQKAPQFLYDTRSITLARLCRQGRPLFWHLGLDETTALAQRAA